MTDIKKKKYKVHIPFITSDGIIIDKGIYEEGQLDLAEARYRSIVTLVEVELELETNTDAKSIPIQTFSAIDTPGLSIINMEPTIFTEKIKKLKINSATVEEISKVRYISDKIAKEVISLRVNQKFTSFSDLNKRIPLKFNRKWEDLTPIDFEETVTTNILEFI